MNREKTCDAEREGVMLKISSAFAALSDNISIEMCQSRLPGSQSGAL